MHRLIIIMALLIGTAAHARLGETEAQLIERYGEPYQRGESRFPAGTTWMKFKKGPVVVSASVLNDQCMQISFRMFERDFTTEERTMLRDANYPGKWGPNTEKGGQRKYLSADGKVELHVEDKSVRFLVVEFYDLALAESRAYEAEQAEKAKAAAEAAEAKRKADAAQGLTGF